MGVPDRLLIFDLLGPMAHFRKFYTSSSSLSYAYPPRTTLAGIIAAVIGRQRDTYYEDLSCENCKIAISVREPLKKIMQTVNYIKTAEGDGFSTAEGVIKRFIDGDIKKYPTPLELVLSQATKEELRYRVYFWHSDKRIMDELIPKIREKKAVYPVSLGLSEFLGRLEFVDEVYSQNIRKCKNAEMTKVVTVCNIEHIDELDFSNQKTENPLQYIEEKTPIEFGANREIKKKMNLIYEKNNLGVMAKFKIPYIEITYIDPMVKSNTVENILFME